MLILQIPASFIEAFNFHSAATYVETPHLYALAFAYISFAFFKLIVTPLFAFLNTKIAFFQITENMNKGNPSVFFLLEKQTFTVVAVKLPPLL